MAQRVLIGIIDYGMGNLRSVAKALEHLGASIYVGDSAQGLAKAQKIILPGVGHFGAAMKELRKRKLIDFIYQSIADGKPFLGICLGLQLLFEQSEENKNVKGLGVWKGNVVRFRKGAVKGLKIPHMGWNSVELKRKTGLMSGVKNGSYFYFVHSYIAKPADSKLIVGTTHYGINFPSALASDNVTALQFHPEKSQSVGLKILKNFIEL